MTQLFWRAEAAYGMTGYVEQDAACDGWGTVGQQTVCRGFETCLPSQNSCHSSSWKKIKPFSMKVPTCSHDEGQLGKCGIALIEANSVLKKPTGLWVFVYL